MSISNFEKSLAKKKAKDMLLANANVNINEVIHDEKPIVTSLEVVQVIPEGPSEVVMTPAVLPKVDPPIEEHPKKSEVQVAENNSKPLKKQTKVEMADQQYAYRPKVHKREKIHDTHTSQAYMIENELISIIDDIVGDAWGGKYRFVNEAIKLMIYQEFPEYAERIRIKE